MSKNKVRGEPIKREKIFLKKTDTRANSPRKKNINITRRATTWKKFKTDQNLKIIAGLCRKGWHNEAIAAYIGISESTFYEWIKKHPEFSEALSIGKDYCVTEVEDALFRRAVGIEKVIPKKEETTTMDIVKDGRVTGKKVTKKVETECIIIPPDTKAATFILTNLAPDDWKQKQQTELTGSVTVDATLKLSDRLQAALKKKEGNTDDA